MAIKLGPKARINGVEPETVFAVFAAREVFLEHEVNEFEWSSGVDRVHADGSLHYVGYAADVWPGYEINATLLEEIAEDLKQSLGAEFDVVVERVHIHIEFQPKKPLNT